MKPMLKRVIIAGVAVVVAGGGIFIAKKAMSGNGSVDVQSVSSLNIGYMDDPLRSSGMVTDAENQSIYADGTKTITEVFVSQGQQVHAGDRLLSYDLTSLSLAVEMSKLETDRIANNITLAEHELIQLQETKPDPDVVPDPQPQPEPENKVPEAASKDDKGAYPYVVNMSEAANAISSQVISYCVTDNDENGSAVKPDENSQWSEEKPQAEEGKTIWFRLHVTYGDNSDKVTEPSVYENQSDDDILEKTGTLDNPYRFRLQENGLVYGKVINDAKSLGKQSYLSFEVYDEDGQLITNWMLRADRFADCENGTAYNVSTHAVQDTAQDKETDSTTSDIQLSGYTAAQLAKAIRDKKQEIKKLNLDLRKAQMKLAEDQASLNDGVVYAKRDGIVRKVSDPANPPQDGSAFLEVASGTGLYVSGFVSELMLDKVNIGDTVSGYSWNDGETYTATITSVDSYPTSNGYYNGSGNPNVSYYGFEAYIEDSSKLSSGDYLDLTIGGSSDDYGSIWISRAYVRKESNNYYVMKEENGRLKKQIVQIGSIAYGEYMEILSGITMDDYLAFPYGKNVKEGKSVQISDGSEGGAYYG